MTPATPPVLYISADTSDLTTRFKATPRMHPGAEVWVPRDPWERFRAAVEEVAHGRGMFGVKAQDDLGWALLHLERALAALPAPDEGEQGEGE